MRRVDKYGVMVWVDEKMDELRRERCLCLNCASMEACSVAARFYAICRAHNTALAVTRCPDWKEKDI